MATVTLSASPATVGALSRWSGYESAYGEVRYTEPSVDGGYAEFDLSALGGAQISAAHLSYQLNSSPGIRHVRFAGTSTEATDANILKRLQDGSAALRLYFSFRASGGTGGEGSFSATCTWSAIALEIEYQSLSGVSGTADFGGGLALSFFTDKASVLRGESALLTLNLNGLSGVSSAQLLIGGENGAYDSATASAGVAPLVEIPFTVSAATWQGRAARAWIKLKLITENGERETDWTPTLFMLCESYLAPVVNCQWTDDSDVYSRFGGFVQRKSLLRCRCAFTLDAQADANVCAVRRTLILGGKAYDSGTDEFEVGSVNLSGSAPYTVTVTDSHGLESSFSGSVSLLSYASPGLGSLRFERYRTLIDGEGNPYYEPDDGSRDIRVSLTGGISPLNGRNAWTLSAAYTDGATQGTATLLSGADGQALNVDADRGLFTALLSEQSDWTVTLTLADSLESAQYEVLVPKGGGIFNIEKGGVAVGMRSGGTRALPKFEVAYPAVFYGDVAFPGMDSLWQSVTLTNCEAFDADWTVKVRKIGDLVFLRGGVKLLSALSSGAAGSGAGVVRLLTLPGGFAPAFPMEFALVPDRTECFLHLRLDIDGSLTLYNRCGYQLGTGALLPLNLCYLRA